jgi:hypothetical protein
LPAAVVAQWASTVQAHYDINIGADEFVLVTTPAWKLQSSEMSLYVGKESSRQSTIALMAGKSEVRFGRIGDIGHPLYGSSNPPPATLLVKFPDAPLVRLRLDSRPEPTTHASRTLSSVVEMLTPTSFGGRHHALQLAVVEIGDEQFAVAARLNGSDMTPTDENNPVMTPPVPNPGSPVKPDAAQAGSTAPASSTASPAAPPANSSQGTSPKSDTQPAPRSFSFPPIPLLTVPRFAIPQTTDSGPTIPDPNAAPEGPRFE